MTQPPRADVSALPVAGGGRHGGDTTGGGLAARVAASPARLGQPSLGPLTRLICVDGRFGAGKTTLAAGLAASLAVLCGPEEPVFVVHLDDLYGGWGGLEAGVERLASCVLTPLREAREARFAAFDWVAGRFGERDRTVRPGGTVIAEGCGAGARSVRPWCSLLIWMDAPFEVRLARALARDGERERANLLRWSEAESAHFAREATRAAADVHLAAPDEMSPSL